MATLTAVIPSRFVAALLAMTHTTVIASEAKQSTTGSLRRCAPRDDVHTAPRDDLQFSVTQK